MRKITEGHVRGKCTLEIKHQAVRLFDKVQTVTVKTLGAAA